MKTETKNFVLKQIKEYKLMTNSWQPQPAGVHCIYGFLLIVHLIILKAFIVLISEQH